MKLKIKLIGGQRLFFTSDTHYNHRNICRGTTTWTDPDSKTRDFDTLEQMNDRIVNNINSVVGQDDILIHLGDWSFGGFESIDAFRNRIHCNEIHLILGNHDHHIERNHRDVQMQFESTNQYVELSVNKEHNFVLMHYPIMSWNRMNDGVIHLHGHVHLPPELRIGEGKMMDVGMDGNNFFPIEMEEVLKLMNNQPIKSGLKEDHHIKDKS